MQYYTLVYSSRYTKITKLKSIKLWCNIWNNLSTIDRANSWTFNCVFTYSVHFISHNLQHSRFSNDLLKTEFFTGRYNPNISHKNRKSVVRSKMHAVAQTQKNWNSPFYHFNLGLWAMPKLITFPLIMPNYPFKFMTEFLI